ncbi:MAG: DUF429 domain-containing protein [Halorubrum sp.]|uniref:DUF429 domain-containing protein n=1 Tax=Halorubrum sp. TaxID=1879286 RepID=UPI00397088B3
MDVSGDGDVAGQSSGESARTDGDSGRATDEPIRVCGVDFSAAATDAGRKTWIASGRVDPPSDDLVVTDLRPLADVAGLDDAGRTDALPALAGWIRERDEATVVGLDFPFGLPRFVVEETGNESWRSFINGFPESIGVNGSEGGDPSKGDGDGDSGDGDGDSGEGEGDGDSGDGDGDPRDPVRAFAERCVGLTERHGEGTYAKRRTDAAVGARSPYGFIADTIAFYGMRDVLASLIDEVRFAPMDRTDGGWRPEAPAGPTAVETYPAAVLDRLGLHRTNYKGSGDEKATRRRRNAEGLAEAAGVVYNSGSGLTETMVADAGGDALDAVAACVGAFTAWTRDYEPDAAALGDPDAVALEGHIYG